MLPSDPRPILQLTDRCVMCGLCLPHCPTYLKTRNESESPRGRIALIQGWASGRLDLTPQAEAHLDRCLGCRACEAACPSGVPYGELLDAARAEIESRRTHRRRQHLAGRIMEDVIPHRRLLRAAGSALRVYRKSGLQRLARRTGLLDRLGIEPLDRLVGPFPAPHSWKPYYPPGTDARGEIALFTGCVSDALDQATLRSAVNLLTRLGFGVHIPRGQTCCGALHQHAGKPEKARALAQANLEAFTPLPVDKVVFAATGCGGQLVEYPRLLGRDEQSTRFSNKVGDIVQFVNGLDWPDHLLLAPLKARVAVHEPCSASHVLRQTGQTQTLLSRIPDIELIPLPENGRCCGAAGSYMITEPEMAQALLADKIAHLTRLAPAILVTTNVGCALHFTAALREAGLDIEVVHPITLLERQLMDNN